MLINEIKSNHIILDNNDSEKADKILEELGNWPEEIHPFMFYMGTDFRKLKFPFIWYDILNVVDTLSKFNYVRKDKRFIEMVDIIKNKKTEIGEYIPESIWKS